MALAVAQGHAAARTTPWERTAEKWKANASARATAGWRKFLSTRTVIVSLSRRGVKPLQHHAEREQRRTSGGVANELDGGLEEAWKLRPKQHQDSAQDRGPYERFRYGGFEILGEGFVLRAVHRAEQQDGDGNHKYCDDQIAYNDGKQTLRGDHCGEHGQSKVGKVREAGVQCHHRRGRRRGAKNEARENETENPSTHQRKREREQIRNIFELLWREVEDTGEKRGGQGHGHDVG